MQARNVAPGAAGAVSFLGVAVVAGALAAADFLVGFPHLGGQPAAFQVRRLSDHGQQVLGAHHAAHAAAPGKSGLALARLQLVDRAAGDRRVGVVPPVFAGRSHCRHVGVGVAVGKRHDLVVCRLPRQVGGVLQRQAQPAVVAANEQIDRSGRAPDEYHLVHAGRQHLGAEFARGSRPHGEGLAVVGGLERAVRGEEHAQAGHELGAGEDAEVHDQRRRGVIGIAHVVFPEGLEGASDAAQEVLHVGAGGFFLLDPSLPEIDAHAAKPVVRELFHIAGDRCSHRI